MTGYFERLRGTVDAHRSPITEEALRAMMGVSTFVKKSGGAAGERDVRVIATVFTLPAEVPVFEPLRESHYLYVPAPSEPWPFALRMVECHLHRARDPAEPKLTGPRAAAEATLRAWIEEHGPEVADSKLRRDLAQGADAVDLEREDLQFLALASLARAATQTTWVLWDPARGRTLFHANADPELPTCWFVRMAEEDAGPVGVVVPYGPRSPTWSFDEAREARNEGLQRWIEDLDALRKLERLPAQELKAQLGASGRSKKAELLQSWYRKPHH